MWRIFWSYFSSYYQNRRLEQQLFECQYLIDPRKRENGVIDSLEAFYENFPLLRAKANETMFQFENYYVKKKLLDSFNWFLSACGCQGLHYKVILAETNRAANNLEKSLAELRNTAASYLEMLGSELDGHYQENDTEISQEPIINKQFKALLDIMPESSPIKSYMLGYCQIFSAVQQKMPERRDKGFNSVYQSLFKPTHSWYTQELRYCHGRYKFDFNGDCSFSSGGRSEKNKAHAKQIFEDLACQAYPNAQFQALLLHGSDEKFTEETYFTAMLKLAEDNHLSAILEIIKYVYAFKKNELVPQESDEGVILLLRNKSNDIYQRAVNIFAKGLYFNLPKAKVFLDQLKNHARLAQNLLSEIARKNQHIEKQDEVTYCEKFVENLQNFFSEIEVAKNKIMAVEVDSFSQNLVGGVNPRSFSSTVGNFFKKLVDLFGSKKQSGSAYARQASDGNLSILPK